MIVGVLLGLGASATGIGLALLTVAVLDWWFGW